MTNTPLNIRAIQSAETIEDAKAICADMRVTLLTLEKNKADARTLKIFSDRYDEAVDEMTYIFGTVKKVS